MQKDIIINDINYTNPIKGKEQQIIDAFVNFYGEDYRDVISKRINDIHFFISYKKNFANENQHQEEVKAIFKNSKRNLFENYLIKTFQKHSLDYSHLQGIDDEIIFDVSFQNISLLFEKLKDTERTKEKLSKDEIKSLQNFCKIFHEDFFELNEDKLKFLINIANDFESAKLTIDDDLGNLYNDYQKSIVIAKQKDELTQKTFLEKVNTFKENYGIYLTGFNYLSPEMQFQVSKGITLVLTNYCRYANEPSVKIAQQFLNAYEYLDINEKIQDNIFENSDINQNFLLKADLFDFINSLGEIDNELTDYFLKLGINLSPNTYEVMNKKYYYEFINDPLIESLGYTRIIFDENKKPLNIIVCRNLMTLSDDTIMHEIGHVITTSNKINNNILNQKTGNGIYLIDLDSENLTPNNDGRTTALMEIINDYFTIKVTNKLNNEGCVLINTDRKKSFYSISFPLFEDILETYMDEIKTAYISEDRKAFEKLFGEQIYNEMVKLADDSFNGFYDTQVLLDRSKSLFNKVQIYMYKNYSKQLLEQLYNQMITAKKHNKDNQEYEL